MSIKLIEIDVMLVCKGVGGKNDNLAPLFEIYVYFLSLQASNCNQLFEFDLGVNKIQHERN